MNLFELAQQCEQASEADHELDAAIAVTALGFFPDDLGKYAYTDNEGVTHQSGQGPLMMVRDFTNSLDAALTLVPEDRQRVDLTIGTEESAASIYFSPTCCECCGSPKPNDIHGVARGATPALAVCAAALRALAKRLSPGVREVLGLPLNNEEQ